MNANERRLINHEVTKTRSGSRRPKSLLDFVPSWFKLLLLIRVHPRLSAVHSFHEVGGGELVSPCGRSFTLFKPKSSRKRLVVPYRIGRPGISARPAIFTRCFSIRLRMVSPHATPRIASMSARRIGCL